MRMGIIRSITGIIVTLIASACAGNQPPIAPTRAPIVGARPTATLAPTQVPTAIPTQAPTATPTATPRPTVTASRASTPQVLSSNGPWLVYRTDHGVMAVNADGTGRTVLTNESILRSDLPDGASSPGGWLALRVGTHSLDEFTTTDQSVELSLLHLPDGQLEPITPLFSPDMQQAIKAAAGERTSAIEAAIAIMENRDALKWSPDGRYLAFIAALDGPSSDLYSYDVTTKKITRLTDGPNQAASLSWSPDSQWIVHEEVEDFGTGAGWNVKAVWAARPDGSEVKKVYTTSQESGGEIFVGWTAPDTFIAYTFRTMGPTAVRTVNVNTGAAAPIDVDILKTGEWYDIEWSSLAARFYINAANGVSGMSMNNRVTRFDQETLLPAISPDGQHMAFWVNSQYGSQYGYRDGLRLYSLDGQLRHEVSKQPVDFATWRPDAQGIFCVSDGTLYYAALPDGQLTPIDEGVPISFEGGIGWVQR